MIPIDSVNSVSPKNRDNDYLVKDFKKGLWQDRDSGPAQIIDEKLVTQVNLPSGLRQVVKLNRNNCMAETVKTFSRRSLMKLEAAQRQKTPEWVVSKKQQQLSSEAAIAA